MERLFCARRVKPNSIVYKKKNEFCDFIFDIRTHVLFALFGRYFPNGISGVLSRSATVFFSYIGFDAIASTAEEVGTLVPSHENCFHAFDLFVVSNW
jgi:hypothetical protein